MHGYDCPTSHDPSLIKPAVVNGYGKHKADLTHKEFQHAFRVCHLHLLAYYKH